MTAVQDSKRNIVLISVDSLRADYCYDAAIPTPEMDNLAASGCRFETAIAPGPATYESMPAIFTGTQPGPTGTQGGVNKQQHIRRHLSAHRPLPERLHDRGYTTIGITPNPFTSRQFGFHTGFDRFVDFFDPSGFGGRIRQRIVARWSSGAFVGGLRFASNMLGLGDVSVPASDVVSRASSELGDVSEPFFLWLMFLDPHWPYKPPREYRDGTGQIDRFKANWRASNLSDATPTNSDNVTLRRLYAGTIRSVDDCLGTLRERLDEFDPVYVIHSDHGEGFGEHGAFGHGGQLYEENIHVPLIVGNLEAAPPVREPTSLRAIPHLVTQVCHGTPRYRSYGSPRTFATAENGALCVRGQAWKYYEDPDGDGRFFDLRTDPEERSGVRKNSKGLQTPYRAHLKELATIETATRDEISLQRL